jgi:probable HAF family extracellular repeat protein
MLFPSFIRSSSAISIYFFRRHASLTVAFLVALAAASPRARAQSTTPTVTYTITDLGILPGGYQTVSQQLPDGQYSAPSGGSYGYAINASGDVTGYSYTQAKLTHAVIFRGGKVIDLGVVPGANSSVGYGINGYDQVTGSAGFSLSNHVFLYSAGKMGDLGTAPGYNSSFGAAINDSAQIAGGSGGSGLGGYSPAFLYNAGEFINLPDHFNLASNINSIEKTGANFFYAYGNVINAAGQIAGGINGNGGAAIYSNGTVSLLNIPPVFAPDIAEGINDTGQTTGYIYYPSGNGETAAFLYSPGKPDNDSTAVIPKLPNDFYSFGTGINAAGQVVGVSYNPGITSDPFLYTPSQGVINVNSLLPAGSKWTLTDAEAINDNGQITGAGINPQGYQHAYLLSPVFVPFATLDAVVDIIGSSKTTFVVGGRFTLGAKSNGIDLLKETAVLQLGGYHIALPPSSFVEKNGIYTYHGKIGNVTLQVTGRLVGRNIYLFGVVGQGAAGLPTSYPLNLVLTIGNETGSEEIKENYGSGLTEAEVCRNFGLTCNN